MGCKDPCLELEGVKFERSFCILPFPLSQPQFPLFKASLPPAPPLIGSVASSVLCSQKSTQISMNTRKIFTSYSYYYYSLSSFPEQVCSGQLKCIQCGSQSQECCTVNVDSASVLWMVLLLPSGLFLKLWWF